MESVAAFAWNGWQASSGISGRIGLEYAGISTITVLEIRGGQIKLGFDAPEELPIQRQNARQKVPLATVTYIHCDPEDGASAV